jgi:hypothetical protein
MRPRNLRRAVLALAGFAALAPAGAAAEPLAASRTENADGSASLASKWALPTPWESKVGVDFTVPEGSPEPILASASESAAAGAAWANLTVQGSTWLPVWEKASLDARVDPYGQQSSLATTFSRSLPAGDSLAVTLENSYALSHSTAADTASQTVSGGGTLRLRFLPTATTLAAATTVSSAGEPWSATVSAGQTLFGLVELNAAMSESESGARDRRLGASYRRKF